MTHNFKRGATSIYVTIAAVLLFSVITASFLKIAINEARRTAADELAQSSYDSALAGIEDAKLALKQYFNCKNSKPVQDPEGNDLCPRIIAAIEKGFASPDTYCDAISTALNRAAEGVEVPIEESAAAKNNFEQAYTCVMLNNAPQDFRAQLDASTPMRAIALKTDQPNAITGIRISWANDNGEQLNYGNASFFSKNRPTVATPPVLSAHIVQTSSQFTLEQFDNSEGDRTNNATVILNPVKTGGTNYISASTLVKSNTHTQTNTPQKIACSWSNGLSDEFACVTSLVLPKPRGDGVRRDDTFYLFLSLPYEQPDTAFSIQLCTDTDSQPGDCLQNGELSVVPFVDSQIAVDSTGRANNMYTRVEARLEFNDVYAPLPEHALYSLSQTGGIDKDFYVTRNCWNQNSDSSAQACSDHGVRN